MFLLNSESLHAEIRLHYVRTGKRRANEIGRVTHEKQP